MLRSPALLGGYVALIAVGGLLVLWYESPRHTTWRRWVRARALRLTGRPDLSWVTAPLLAALAAAGFAVVVAVLWAVGEYRCTSSGPPDLMTLVASGRAFLTGGDPFTITACGLAGNPVPAGMASVLLDGLGALAGPVGILLVWGGISVAVVPLVWRLAGDDRATATAFVLASFLYLPIVAVQVDGASLALVPVTTLLVVSLARQGWPAAAAVGGFLATGRFPALFPIVGASGRAGRLRLPISAAALGAFATVTLLTVAVYGARFTGPVFFMQFARSNFALNYWGLLEGEGWLEPSTAVTVVQALATVVLVAVVWAWARSEVGAVAIVLTGTVLLTQYLSFTELVFLLPVALVGPNARWWLWAIGAVAATNYLLALRSLASVGGQFVLSYALDLALTVLLVGLLIDLLRGELRLRSRESATLLPARPGADGDPGRS